MRASTWAAAAMGALAAMMIIVSPALTGRVAQPAHEPRARAVAIEAAPARQKVKRVVARFLAEKEKPNDVPATGPVVQAAWQGTENVVEISADDPLELAMLSTGQTVRGNAERRPLVEVHAQGLEVVRDGLTFENIDFVVREPLAPGSAMLTLRNLKTTFHGCSFQTTVEALSNDVPIAIRWDREVGPAEANADLATGELEIRDTAFRNVAAASCRVAGGMVLRFQNVLKLGSGPFVQVDRFPAADEVLALAASRVTLRGGSSLVEVGCDHTPELLGRLEIDAGDCAFALASAAALVMYHGETRPGPLLKGLHWSGQGSVVSPRSRLAIWRMPEGRMLAAADEAVPIQGVARGEIGFSGGADEGPAGSRVVRWQGPPSSLHPPGIDGGSLHLPAAD